MQNIMLILIALLIASCSPTSVDPDPETMYFPPISQGLWETTSTGALNWNSQAADDLKQYLETKNTKSFIILVDGKMVIEQYMNGHTQSDSWYWASAGKTLTATITGIAEQEGHLHSGDMVSAHLGTGWTLVPVIKENLITVRHLLTMTSGLDDALGDDVSPQNLQYLADAGTRWAYHNAYVKLQDVVEAASGEAFSAYFNSQLRDRIGMTGIWVPNGDLQVYWSNARSMARFGLLMLNRGKWQNEVILTEDFYDDAVSSSQQHNQAYGYMWWLNGKNSFMLPQSQLSFNGSLIPTGPADMVMALGKNDQKIYVIPSKKMVVVRMGESADGANFALSDFDQVLWEKISALYQ